MQFDSIRFNSIQFDSIRFISIRFDSIRPNSIQFDSIRFNSIQFDSVQADEAYGKGNGIGNETISKGYIVATRIKAAKVRSGDPHMYMCGAALVYIYIYIHI